MSTLGTILCRVLVPLWLFAGAIFKIWELNPNVLPAPVKAVVLWIGELIAADPATWLVQSMRAMIAVELALVLIMLLVPKLARAAAISILSLFCVILAFELIAVFQSTNFERKGFRAFLEPCGCFGAWSPPTFVTFMIDSTLLLGCILCPQSKSARDIPSPRVATGALLASLVLGPAVAWGRPGKAEIIVPPSPDAGQQADAGANDGQEANPASTKGSTQGSTQGEQSTGTQTNGAASAKDPATPWPAFPAKLSPTYVILDKKAIGQPFASLPTAALLSKLVPADMQQGRKTLVFYRKTCDHCFEMMNKHFSGALKTPTYSIQVPDSTGGKSYPNPCKDCVKWDLPAGPDYMIQTPMVITLVDGVIAAICKDPDKPGALDATLNAWAPGHEKATAVDGMLLAALPSAPAPAGTAAQPAPAKPATKPFPPMPSTIPAVMAPEFDKWPGKRLDELDLPMIITRPLPIDVNSGSVILMFYRVDCEHCEQVLFEHFSNALPAPTLLVSIPDSMGEPFENPCSACQKTSLVAGPTFVVETPVLVVASDGVVKEVLVGSQLDNKADVEAVLKSAAASPAGSAAKP